MNSSQDNIHFERIAVAFIIATILFVFSYGSHPRYVPAIIAALSILAAILAVTTIELTKFRNVHVDRARGAEFRCALFRKRMDSLNDENRRLFNVYLSHLPVEVIVQTLASMGGGPIRIRDFGPESEWYQVATSPQYQHLFNQDDLRKLKSRSINQEDDAA